MLNNRLTLEILLGVDGKVIDKDLRINNTSTNPDLEIKQHIYGNIALFSFGSNEVEFHGEWKKKLDRSYLSDSKQPIRVLEYERTEVYK